MRRCEVTGLLVEECADCRAGRHTEWFESKASSAAASWPEAGPDVKLEAPSTAPTVAAEASYLLTAVDRLAEADWVGEAMADIRLVWSALTKAHGLIGGPAIGPCLRVPCAGKVYRDRFTGFPKCNTCHYIYEGRDVLKIQLTEEAAR